MKFEHLIRMTPPPGVEAPFITRGQLWQGLLLRVSSPMDFDENISRVEVKGSVADGFVRETFFGELAVVEHIVCKPGESVIYRTEASAQHPAGMRSMAIEEPESGVLFVRFSYDTGFHADDSTSPEELERLLPYLQSAYRENDLDTARKILQLAASGQLTAAQ